MKNFQIHMLFSSVILIRLENESEVPKELVMLLQYMKEDVEALKQWTKIAFQSKSLEEFEEKFSL